MDRGNHRPDRHADIDQNRLGQLKARLDRLGHRIGSTDTIKMRRMVSITGSPNNQQVAAFRSRPTTSWSVATRSSNVTHEGPCQVYALDTVRPV